MTARLDRSTDAGKHSWLSNATLGISNQFLFALSLVLCADQSCTTLMEARKLLMLSASNVCCALH